MFGLVRASTAARAQDRAVFETQRRMSNDPAALRHRAAQAREDAARAHRDLVERLTTAYYAASALAPGNPHQTGTADGLRHAIAIVVDKSSITVGYELEHGIPPGNPDGWACVVDGPFVGGRGGTPVLLRPGTPERTPVDEHLANLHAHALAATDHPLAATYAERAGR